jgi:hypothetical protein
VDTVTISGATITGADSTVQLTANVLPTNAADRAVTWALAEGSPTEVTLSSTTTNPTTVNIPAGIATGTTITVIATSVEVTTVNNTHTITVSDVPFPLFSRVLQYGHRDTNANANTGRGNFEFTDGNLVVRGGGTTDNNNFRGHIVWVGVPATLESFAAELDLSWAGTTFDPAHANSMVALIAARNPGVVSDRELVAYLTTLGSGAAGDAWDFRVRRTGKLPGAAAANWLANNTNLAAPGSPAADTTTNDAGWGAVDWDDAGTITLGMRGRAGNVTPFHFYTVDGEDERGTNAGTGLAIDSVNLQVSDQFYIGIFVSANGNTMTQMSTATVSALRIRFNGTGDLVDIPLNTPITTWTAP